MPPRIARFDLTNLQQSPAYDALMRLPMLAWTTVLAIVSAASLERYARSADLALPGAVYTVKIALARNEVGRGMRVGRVRLGMAGQAEIITRRESLLFLLVKKLRMSISLG